MIHTRILMVALLVAAATGCTQPSIPGTHDSVMKHITLQGDRVGANAQNGKVAWIDRAGGVEIDGQQIALNEVQRALTLQYYTQAMALRDDGLAVGKAGTKLASSAIGEVAKGLASGNPDQIGDKIEVQAGTVEAQAMQLCRGVGKLQAAQDAIVVALPAFAPYATIDEHVAADCRS